MDDGRYTICEGGRTLLGYQRRKMLIDNISKVVMDSRDKSNVYMYPECLN
jgi:hypothetical protein